MALHVVIGFETSGPTSPAEAIYVGRDAETAGRTRDAYPGARTLWLRNPRGITKVGAALAFARDAANRAAEIAAAGSAPVADPSIEQQLADARGENDRLRARLAKAERAAAIVAESASAAPAAPGEIVELALDDLASIPTVQPSEPAAVPQDDAAAGEETEPASVEDPEAAARRQAAEAAAAAAEQIEESGPAKKRGRGK